MFIPAEITRKSITKHFNWIFHIFFYEDLQRVLRTRIMLENAPGIHLKRIEEFHPEPLSAVSVHVFFSKIPSEFLQRIFLESLQRFPRHFSLELIAHFLPKSLMFFRE